MSARKARKVLTEFSLEDGKKLRIDVLIWGDETYAKEMKYHGNVVYIPLLVNKNGKAKRVYPWEKGLPTLDDLDDFYKHWAGLLSDKREKRRLKELAITLRELADESTFFNTRQAHVVYKLLQIARREPRFTITKLGDIDKLSAKMRPALVIEFCGYKFIKPVEEFEYDTPIYNLLKSMENVNERIEEYVSNMKDDLARLVRRTDKDSSDEFPKISLDIIADEVEKWVSKNS